LAVDWFPAIRQAVRQLPEQGSIHAGRLDSPQQTAQTLAETNFLTIVLDLQRQRNVTQSSDLLIEFHQSNFQICSLFGCLLLNYPKAWEGELNRVRLGPWWEAWEPILLGIAGLVAIVILFLNWAFLATIYCAFVRLLGFFKDRDLNWASSWRLASAALMPGALLLTLGIFCYGLGLVDLIRLLLLFILHFVVGWIYLAISPVFVPRLPAILPRGINPFTPATPEPNETKEG